jgi:phosphatidylglycerophosphate synthase
MKTSNSSFLRDAERSVIEKLCARVPPFIGTKHFTFLSLLSSFLVFVSYYISAKKPYFLFFASFFIILQWVFDCLDGAIGRLRKEGFIEWGFYMDHLFDYFFMASIVFGLYFLFPDSSLQILVLFLLFSSFMINSFLLYASIKTKEPGLVVSFWHFSPIEFRLLVILFNTLLFFFESTVRNLAGKYLFCLNILLLTALIALIFSCQKKLNQYDISNKDF